MKRGKMRISPFCRYRDRCCQKRGKNMKKSENFLQKVVDNGGQEEYNLTYL